VQKPHAGKSRAAPLGMTTAENLPKNPTLGGGLCGAD
jgi:hypothetical protein